MKSNWIKYIFAIFIIIVLIFAIVKIRSDEKQEELDAKSASQEDEKVREIRVGIANLDTINPILSNNKNVQDITKLIYEPLVNITSDYKAEPCLATEWAKEENSYLIKLRENVKWSDGLRFTAEDVRFTIDRLKEINSIYSYNVAHVIGVDIVDDYTIRINLDGEVPFFEYNLIFPILSKDYFEGEDFVNSSKNASPSGTGKYKIANVEGSSITLAKNENWWNRGTSLSLEKITINLYSSIGELYNSFKIGNLDVVATTNDNVETYIGTLGYTAKSIKGREHTFLALNMQNQILANQEVRRAISYSIDKENIVSSIFSNKRLTSSFVLDYGSFLYQNQEGSSGYNVGQAKNVLTEAGWTFRSSSWQKTINKRTQRITLNLLVKSSDGLEVAVAENIKTQLANQGIRINVVQANDEQYQNKINARDYDIALCSINLSLSPDLTTFFGQGNLANYSNEEVTNLMNEVKNTKDEETLKNDYRRLAEIYKTDVPYISLYNNRYLVAYHSELVGDLNPNWYTSFYGVENWYK